MTYGPVAIFWDYENCSPQHGAGFSVVDNIRQIAHRYGSVKFFKAYLELSEQNSSKSLSLRSELQSCGVSLTDCPHNGRKDVADKMMIVDMLTYAIDTPAPATIILISGDRDFVYAVSVLRLRQYHVVVVAPATAHSSLRSRASELHDWEYAVAGKVPPSNHGHTSYASDASAGRGWIDGENGEQHPGHRHTQSSGSVARSRRHSFRDDGVYSPNIRPDSLSPVKPTRQGPGVDSVQDFRREYGNAPFVFPKPSTNHHHAHSIGGESGREFSTQAKPTAHGSLSVPLKGLSPTPIDTTLLSPISPATNATTLRPPEPDTSHVPTHCSIDTTAAAAETARDNLKGDSTPISDVIGDAEESISARKNETEKQTTSYAPRAADICPLGPLSTEVPVIVPTGRLATTDPLVHFPSNCNKSMAPPLTVDRLGVSFCMPQSVEEQRLSFGDFSQPSIVLPSPPPPVSPANFAHMVDILDRARHEGQPTLLRSHVAVKLMQKNPAVYQEAGVTKFKEYAALAQSMGLIELGGMQGNAWIALSSSYSRT